MKLNKKHGYLFIAILFFCSVFYYFYVLADHVIYYQNSRSLFLFDSHFFKEHILRPGGLISYFSDFVTQFFYYKWLGVLLLTLLLALTTFLTYKVCVVLQIRQGLLFHFLPALLFISLYIGDGLNGILGMLFSTLAFYFFLNIKSEKRAFIYALLIFPLLYVVAAGYSLVFITTIIIYTLLLQKHNDRFIYALVYVLAGIAIPFLLLRYIYVFSIWEGYTNMLLLYPAFGIKWAHIVFLIYLPLLPLLSKLRIPLRKKSATLLSSYVPLIVFTFFTIYVYKVSLNDDFRLIMDIEEYAMEEDWQSILELSAKRPNASEVNAVYNTLALYETGRLSSDMFVFPHVHFEDGLVPRWSKNPEKMMAGSDIYYRLGLYNASYRWAFEYMVSTGLDARSLQRVAITSLLNKDYEVAEKYFLLLKKTIFYRKWAAHYSDFLYEDHQQELDPVLGKKIKHVVSENSFVPIINNEPNFRLLLRANSRNKMAYEYLMAQLLFKKDLEAFAEQLQKLDDYGYKEMPVLWGEALMVHNILFDDNRIHLDGFPISNETYDRFDAYSKEFPQYLKNRDQGAKALRARYGNTYWYYHHFEKLRKVGRSNSQKIDR